MKNTGVFQTAGMEEEKMIRLCFTHEIKENNTVETRERRMEPIKALQNPSTTKPGVIRPANSNNPALMINVNNPSVKILMGRVKSTKTGLMRALISPMIRAATSAVVKSLTAMPVTILETIYKDKAFTNHRISTFIKISVSYLRI